MTDIFLSYSSEDRTFVEQIKLSLESQNYKIWMDKYKICGGDDWEESIRANVCSSKVFVVVVSESSNKSTWVKRECLQAEKVGKPRIPLRLRKRKRNSSSRSRSRSFIRRNGSKSYVNGNGDEDQDQDDDDTLCTYNAVVDNDHDHDDDEYSECDLPFRIMDLQYIDFFTERNNDQQQMMIAASSSTASYQKSMTSLLEVLSKYLGPRSNHFRRTSSQKSVTFYEGGDECQDLSNSTSSSQITTQYPQYHDDVMSVATSGTTSSSSTRQGTRKRHYDDNNDDESFGGATATAAAASFATASSHDGSSTAKICLDDYDCSQSLAAMSVTSGHTSTCTPPGLLESTTSDGTDSSSSSSTASGNVACGGTTAHHNSHQYILHQNSKHNIQQLKQMSPTFNNQNNNVMMPQQSPPPRSTSPARRGRQHYHNRVASFHGYGSHFDSSNEMSPSPPSSTTTSAKRLHARALSFNGYSSSNMMNIDDQYNNNNNNEEEEPVTTTTIKYDLLTVFQAAPLAYISADDNQPKSMQQAIDFEFERDLLNRTFADACCYGREQQQQQHQKIYVEYEKATTDRLGYFLAKGEGRLLHFSCHGHPEYLALEDNWGGLSMLQTTQLQNWITKDNSRNLEFVFVSACHSSLIGEAFVNAGVPHVLCCRYDSQLREDAAVEFEKLFYRYLAFDNTLKYSFDMACREIMVNPNIPAEHRADEVQKFCLLPADQNHDVKIFYQRPLPQNRRKQYIPPVMFPPPPQICIGREVDQYKLLQAIKRSRLVKVSGDRGIGKSALVQSCCRYLNERLHIVGFDELLWIPCPNVHQRTANPFDLFENALNLIGDESDKEAVLSFLDKSRESIHKIIEYFLSTARKTLLIIDSKRFLLRNEIARLCLFIQELLKGTQHLKVVVIHQIEFDITTDRMPGSEETVCLEPLDFDSTIALFSRLCPHHQHLSSSASMSSILESQQQEQATHQQLPHRHKINRRRLAIFQTVGGGIPNDVHLAAKMTLPEFEQLMVLVRQNDQYSILPRSRSELEKKQKEIDGEIAEAAKRRDFRKAEELQAIFDELESQKDDFPDKSELIRLLEDKTYQIHLAMSARDWAKAGLLQKELDKLEVLIQLETDVEDAYIKASDADVLATRAALEAKLLQNGREYDAACEDDDFAKAREIDIESEELRALRKQKPSRADYSMEVNRLKSELDNAKANHSLDAAEIIYKRLVEAKKKRKLEEEAESAFGISVGSTAVSVVGEIEAKENYPPPPHPAKQQSSKHRIRPSLESQQSASSLKSQDPPGLKGAPTLETRYTQQTMSTVTRQKQRQEAKEIDKAKEEVPALSSLQRGIAGEFGTEPPGVVFNEPLREDLAYNTMSIGADGSVMNREDKLNLRNRHGYCTECEGSPTMLYDVNENIVKSVSGDCAGGVCFICHPDQDPQQEHWPTVKNRNHPNKRLPGRRDTSPDRPQYDNERTSDGNNATHRMTHRMLRASGVEEFFNEEGEDSSDSDNESNEDTIPGALAVQGVRGTADDGTVQYSMGGDSDNMTTVDELQEFESSLPVAAAPAAQEEDEPIVAELVKEQQDLEAVIMDTLRRNTVQAESVEVEGTSSPTNNRPRRMKSIRNLFKKWGKKKKK